MFSLKLDGYISNGCHYIIVTFTRRSRLMRIMEIDQNLHTIESNVMFRKMRNNLNILETKTFGSRYIKIGSPENLENMIELRRYSKEMDEVILGYKKGLEKYEDRIGKLHSEKKQLQNELFPIR